MNALMRFFPKVFLSVNLMAGMVRLLAIGMIPVTPVRKIFFCSGGKLSNSFFAWSACWYERRSAFVFWV